MLIYLKKLFFKNPTTKFIFAITLLIQLYSCKRTSNDNTQTTQLAAGTNSFVFTYAGLPQKPINVYCHIPQGDKTTMPILLLFHGDERNAVDYRNWCKAFADQYHFMVFAPEFNDKDFTGGSGYAIGNVYTDGNNPTPTTFIPEAQWTFSYIEPLFDYIKLTTASMKSTYKIFGHSGGAQFVHRLLMFKPNSRIDTAVAANSGWYTATDANVKYPYGLSNSPLSTINPNSYFSKKMIVSLGKLDTISTDPSLRHNVYADAQGLNRLARGKYFFQKSQTYSTAVSANFNWQLNVVPNSGHDPILMLQNAVSIMFQ